MPKEFLESRPAFSGVREAAKALGVNHSWLLRAATNPKSKYVCDRALRRGGDLVPLWSDRRLRDIKRGMEKK